MRTTSLQRSIPPELVPAGAPGPHPDESPCNLARVDPITPAALRIDGMTQQTHQRSGPSRKNGPVRIGVDIGGTFTDIALETGDRRLETSKVPTTPREPEQGVMTGIRLALEKAGVTVDSVHSVIHGTTLATNALIERKGARTALVCTRGFRDTLRLAYENRYDQYDIWLTKPEPLVPRHLTWPVTERMDVTGSPLVGLDEASVLDVAKRIRDEGIESVAVGLLHAYANPRHEERVREILQSECPDVLVTLSSEACPEVREYERLTTTVCNAYVRPLMARYLRALASEFDRVGILAPLLLMTSGGSVCSLETAVSFPVRLVESGPSAGAVLAARVAARRGDSRVLSCDMGGTTAKICLIDDARPQTARVFEIARAARFTKGSGMTVRLPVIEMIEIGAGGGSIAGVDGLGRITVGPRSAGSEPGPSCYARGGGRATVTDADLVLGRLEAAGFAGGTMTLDTGMAREAIRRDIGDPLSMDVQAGALGMSEVVDENMASAAQVHAVERGKVLRQCTMIAFGGAGPLHACRMAEKLGIRHVVIPLHPGVGSAVGMLRAPVAFEVVRSRYMTLSTFDAPAVAGLYAAMADEASAIVRQGAGDAPLEERRSCFMRYLGQGHEIEVPVSDGPIDHGERKALQAAYDKEYARQYARSVPGMDVEILGWKLVVAAPLPEDPETVVSVRGDEGEGPSRRHLVDPAAGKMEEVPVFRRESLDPGATFEGPCVITEGQTTTVVTASFHGQVDHHGHIALEARKEVPS